MYYQTYQTKSGLIMVIANENHSSDEYTVASLFKDDGNLYYAQLAGTTSPKPFLDQEYKSTKTVYDDKKNVYTIRYKEAFKYSFPPNNKVPRLVIATTEQAAWHMIENLVGLDKKDIKHHFSHSILKDQGPLARIGILLTYNSKEVKTVVDGEMAKTTEFELLERKPIYFKGGEIGDIN